MPIRPRSPRIPFFVAAAGIALIGALPASAQPITEDLKITPTDGTAGDDFGHSVAMDGGVLSIGAWLADDNGSSSGSAYLYNASTGAFLHELLPSDGIDADRFGKSVAVSENIAAVGAIGGTGIGLNTGAAYLFDATLGTELRKIFSADGVDGDQFGHSIAVGSGVVAVGAPGVDDVSNNSGAVYLFDAATGAQLFKLTADDASIGDHFGYSVAIDSGVVAIGARYDDVFGNQSGSAYLFDATTGQQIRKLIPDDGAASDWFGGSIAIGEGLVAVGAVAGGSNNTGAAYLFDASTGQQLHRLVPGDAEEGDQAGVSVGLSGGTVVVGAYRDDDNGLYSGSAYLFDAISGSQILKLLPSDGAEFHEFGISTAIDSGVVSVGSTPTALPRTETGYVYLYNVPSTDCIADVNGDGTLSPADFSAWVAAFNTGTPACDQNGDGSCTPADFSAWVANYNAGC